MLQSLLQNMVDVEQQGAIMLPIKIDILERLQPKQALTRSLYVGDLFGGVDAEYHRVIFPYEYFVL